MRFCHFTLPYSIIFSFVSKIAGYYLLDVAGLPSIVVPHINVRVTVKIASDYGVRLFLALWKRSLIIFPLPLIYQYFVLVRLISDTKPP